MAAIDAVSSWLPQAEAQSPPPMAQAPKPARVRCMPVRPSRVVGREVVMVELLVSDRSRAFRAHRWCGWEYGAGSAAAWSARREDAEGAAERGDDRSADGDRDE